MARKPDKLTAEAVRRNHRRANSRRSAPLSSDAVRQSTDDALEAVTLGSQLRAHHRRRRLTSRCHDLQGALAALNRAQQPLRSELGRLARAPRRERAWGDEVRAASDAVIRERKKIRKMSASCP